MSIREELAEALRPEHQLTDHDDGPAVPYEVKAMGSRARVAVVGVTSTNRH